MNDFYIQSPDAEALKAFCAKFRNVLGPAPGRAAAESVGEDGQTISVQQAAGDESLFYACLRAEKAPDFPDGITACDATIGAAVLGVWV